MKNLKVLTIILVVIVGAGGFFVGMQYQKMQRGNSGPSGQGAGRIARTQGQNGNFRPVRGEIISSDDKSITVKTQGGSSKIVLFSGSVSITEATSAGKESLKIGKQVMVFGSDNSDGSVTAQNIQLNPMFRGTNQ